MTDIQHHFYSTIVLIMVHIPTGTCVLEHSWSIFELGSCVDGLDTTARQLLAQTATSTALQSKHKCCSISDSHGVSGLLGGSLTERGKNIDQVEWKTRVGDTLVVQQGQNEMM